MLFPSKPPVIRGKGEGGWWGGFPFPFSFVVAVGLLSVLLLLHRKVRKGQVREGGETKRYTQGNDPVCCTWVLGVVDVSFSRWAPGSFSFLERKFGFLKKII